MNYEIVKFNFDVENKRVFKLFIKSKNIYDLRYL